MARVSVVEVGAADDTRQEVLRAVQTAMDLAQWKDHVSAGADISLKPNLGWDLFLPGAVSAPWVVEAVIRTIRDHVGRIYVVESDQVLVNIEKALRQTGIAKVCRDYDVQWVNMSRGRFHKVKCNGLVLKEVDIPEILLRTQVITLPVLKTHGRTTITGAIKNQWGCLRELRHNYHLVVNEALADVNSIVRPVFAVMDGTVGLEGNGPKSGKPKIADLVLASPDIVALDSVAARLMGFDPLEIAHLRICAQRGLGVCGNDEVDVVGVDPRTLGLRFQAGSNNTIAVVEMLLRKSSLRRLVFGTPLFGLSCLGAKLWYWIWYYCYRGRRYRNEILASRYGDQWR